MKVGDKVLCKKDVLWNEDNPYKEIIFHKNQFYQIKKIWFVNDYKKHYGSFWNFINIEAKNDLKDSYWVEIINEYGRILHYSLTKMHNIYYFNEYFYSTKETRKNNLLKINELCKSTKYESR
jgi:hypothetical protein